MGLLDQYLRPQQGWVGALALLLLSGIGLRLIGPQIARRFIDAALAAAEHSFLMRMGGLFLLVALAQQATSVAAAYLGEKVAWSATNTLRCDLAAHCLRLDMSYHTAHTPGEMIERVDGDVAALANFFSQFVIQIAGNVLLVIGMLIVLFAEDLRAGLALSLLAVVALAVLIRLRGIAIPHFRGERQASAEVMSFLEERLSGIEDIRACGAVEYVLQRFLALLHGWMRASLVAGQMTNLMVNAMSTLIAVGQAVAFVVGAILYQQGVFTIGAVYMLLAYAYLIMAPIQRITQEIQDLQRAGAAIDRVRELLGTESRIRDGSYVEPHACLPSGALAVELRGVTFTYEPWSSPESPGIPVLRDVSFSLPAGRTLGLLGRTGSGKTTLSRLLFRLYDPQAGAVLLGEERAMRDVRQITLGELRARVGMVTQNVELFDGTVRDNLTFWDSTISTARIEAVLRELGLSDWLDALPQGLESPVSAGGASLSAGQAQLLAMARVFLQDPGLVIMDEASSRLDPATEELVQQATNRLLAGRSGIIIAHRLATMESVDHILILDEGRVVEQGPRAALAADPTSRLSALLYIGLEEVLA